MINAGIYFKVDSIIIRLVAKIVMWVISTNQYNFIVIKSISKYH